MEAVVEEDIEYAELLHDEHQESDAEDASIDLQDGKQQANSVQELTALQMEENCANEGEEICEEEQVMLVEATEVIGDMDVDDTQHTIIEHEGRQYLIPTEQLNGVGHTLVVEDEECGENEEEMEEVESNYEVLESDANGFYSQDAASSGRQFAVLRDGRLHLSNEQDTVIQEKLRAFEETLNGYDEDEVAEDTEDHVQQEEDANSSQEENEAITGRNLVTGQTISLRGFMEKMRRREETKKEEFVTVRPINSRVVVGRTSDGKRLIGKILQIQKKVQPLTLAPATPRPKAPTVIIPRNIQTEASQQQEEEEEEYCPLPEKRPKALVNRMMHHPTSVVSEQVARTLAGLMSLQTVRSSIARRKLLVRHVQKHSAGGKVVVGSRRVAYYSGAIRPMLEPPHWKFISDPPTSTSIDLPTAPQHPQTVSLLPVANCIKKELMEEADDERDEEEDWGEALTLHLTETHDEHGIKKTKVSIPQLGGCNVSLAADETKRVACLQCGKRFHTTGAMRRHQAAHNLPERKPLTCHVCLKKFATLGGLNEHLRMHEHRSAPLHRYDCSVCRKQFNRHSNLLRHAHIHRTPPPPVDPAAAAKGPPFVCTQCECQYNFISSLTRHIVTEHKA